MRNKAALSSDWNAIRAKNRRHSERAERVAHDLPLYIPNLIQGILEEEDESVREANVEELGQFRQVLGEHRGAARDALVSRLDSRTEPAAAVRLSAARELLLVANEEVKTNDAVISALAACLAADPEVEVRLRAAATLCPAAAVGSRIAIRALGAAANDDPNTEVRDTAAEYLAELGIPVLKIAWYEPLLKNAPEVTKSAMRLAAGTPNAAQQAREQAFFAKVEQDNGIAWWFSRPIGEILPMHLQNAHFMPGDLALVSIQGANETQPRLCFLPLAKVTMLPWIRETLPKQGEFRVRVETIPPEDLPAEAAETLRDSIAPRKANHWKTWAEQHADRLLPELRDILQKAV